MKNKIESDFFQLPEPYLDFALVNAVDFDPSKIRNLKDGLSHDGIGLYELRFSQSESLLIISPNLDNVLINEGEKSAFAISGIAKVSSKLYVPWKKPTSNLFDQIDPECGSFVMFDVRASKTRIANDLFGYGQIFASQHKGCAIASNRLHLHRLVMKHLGIIIYPDEAVVMSFLFGHHGFFSQQSSLRRTAIKGVEHVPVDCLVSIKEGKLSRIEKSQFSNLKKVSSSDYEILIKRGIDKIVENTAAAINDEDFAVPIVDLTAGKDSRMVFSSAINTNNWRSRVRINTLDFPGDDLAVSCGVSNLFGAQFYEGDETEQSPVSLDESLKLWRSYFFGQYHRYGCGAWANKGLNRTEIAIGGANGEIYRTFWGAVVTRQLATQSTVKGFADSLVSSSAIKSFYSKDQLQLLVSALSDELDSLPGDSLREKIEDHYLFHRNRAHCGLRGFTFYHDRLTWYPLQSADLLGASRAIGYDERSKNRVIFDVLRELHPVLTDLRFEGGNPFRELASDHRSLKGGAELFMNEDRTAWQSAAQKSKEKNVQRRSGKKPTMRWVDLPLFMSKKVNMAASSLSNSYLQNILPDDLAGEFDKLMKINARSAYQFASRIFYIHDALL